MKVPFGLRSIAVFMLVSLVIICAVQATAQELLSDECLTVEYMQSDARYTQVKCAPDDAMYVGKNIETGQIDYFNVEVIGERALTHRNGITERTAPEYAPVSFAKKNTQPDINDIKGIIGSDSRERVSVSNELPYSAVAYIESHWPDGSTSVGTAWMFYGDIAITAGHCVYSNAGNYWATYIDIWVGTNGTKSSARATGRSKNLYTSTLWISSAQAKDDWGVIKLTEDIALNTGYLGIYYTTADMSGRSIEIPGYPGDHPLWQYTATGTIDHCETAVLFYTVDTYAGQSGSPILIDGGNKSTGIHNTGFFIDHGTYIEYTMNGGARMTPSLFDYLMSFRN